MSKHNLAIAQSPPLHAILRSDFLSFVRKVFVTLNPAIPFLPNWHLQAMAYALTRVASGETTRLVINVPPRHLKSIAASVALPAFALGHQPSRRIICVSYSQDLAVKHSNDCRAVMLSDWYQRTFPGTRIDPEKNTEIEFMTTKRGFRFATSVGGTLTGRGGDIIVIDDPIKPSDAMAKVARDRVKEWAATTLLSRLDNKLRDCILCVMQRVHVDDLSGHYLDQGGWDHLNLAAIAETEESIEIAPGRRFARKAGDVLHPDREPIEVLEKIRSEMGSAAFAAQYQQSPVPPGGHMIDWNWFSSFEPQFEAPYNDIVISWDTAMTASELADYSVGTVWGVKGDFCYLLDLVRVRQEYPSLRRTIIDLYRQYPGSTLLIEYAGSGISLFQDLQAQGISVVDIPPDGDKILRMSAQSAKIEAGRVYLPREAAWLDQLRTELLAFPHGSHDDQADSISQALNWIWRPRREFHFG